jgi:hypothetical protein
MNSKTTTTTNSNQKESKNKNHLKNKDMKLLDSENNTLSSNPTEDNVLDTTEYIVTPSGLDEPTLTLEVDTNLSASASASANTSSNTVDDQVNLLNEIETEQQKQINKLTEQLDFFKNLAEENKEEIYTLKTTLDENKRLVLQLVEENEQLKNNLAKKNNIDLLLKLKENFANKSVELVEELKYDNEVENTNINKLVEEKMNLEAMQAMQSNTNPVSLSVEQPKVVVVKPKKKGNPFARRFL